MIELRHLRQFVAVAEELSFRKAAVRLHMAQPPLTAAIRKMEEELGVRLLERSNKVERLTPAGQVFLDEARRTLAQAERAIHAARRAGEGMTGSLRVTFVASAAQGFLPRVLRRFRERHADVELALEEATTAQQVAALREDRADVGIVVLPVDDPVLSVDTLHKEQLVAALPKGHRLTAHPSLSLADLAEELWVLFPRRYGPGLHDRIVAACARAGFAPRVVQEAVQMETIAGLVAGAIGVSLVPPSIAAVIRPGVVYRPLIGEDTGVGYDLGLAFVQRSQVLDAFAATARAIAAEDSESVRSPSHRPHWCPAGGRSGPVPRTEP